MKLAIYLTILSSMFIGCATMQPKPTENFLENAEWKKVNLYLSSPVVETNKDGVVEIKEWKYYPLEMEGKYNLIRPIIEEKK